MTQEIIYLFFSYGHDACDMRIINEIQNELLKPEHGFRLWIDKDSIWQTRDWREEIVRGISETKMTLGMLSQYSTRDRSVCLCELGISISIPGRKLITVLLEDQKAISIPSTVTRDQWIDLSKWRDYINTDQWNEYFHSRMDVMIASIRSPENVRFQGEVTKLYRILKPEPFDSKISLYLNEKLSEPREWLKKRVNRKLQDNSSGRFILLTGNAGTGKGHFSAVFQHYNPECAAGAFLQSSHMNSSSAKDLVRYLIYTLATKYADFRRQILDRFKLDGLIDTNDDVSEARSAVFFSDHSAEWLFDRFLCAPMIGGHDTNVAIVIDGLDEASDGESNPVLDLLCNSLTEKLPPHLKIIITSRPEPSLMAKIEKLRPSVISLEDEMSDDDIRQYIRDRMADANLTLPNDDEENMVSRCGRVFLYAKLLCDVICDGNVDGASAVRIPKGLGGVYRSYFDRMFPDLQNYERLKPFLTVICAFDTGPLSEKYLIRATNTDADQLNRFFLAMKSFAQRRIIDQVRYVYLFHKSLYDWLTDASLSGPYYIDRMSGQHVVMDLCRTVIAEADDDTDYETLKNTYRYVLAHGNAFHVALSSSFLYTIQLAAYNNSDSETYTEITRKLERMTRLTGDLQLYILSQLSYAGWLYDVMGESDEAVQLIEKLYRENGQFLNDNPEIYTAAEVNRIYIEDSQFGEHEKMLLQVNNLIEYILSRSETELPCRWNRLARAYYYQAMIEFRLGKKNKAMYTNCINSADLALEASEMGYADPRKLKCLIYIIQGGAFRKVGNYDMAIRILRLSLEYRQALYSRYSLFIANAHLNLIHTFCQQAENTGEALNEEVFMHLRAFGDILIMARGNTYHGLALYWFWSAKAFELNGEYEHAVHCAEKCLQFENVPSKKNLMDEMRQLIMKRSG